MFKVMTLNINGYGDKHGVWPLRRDRILDAIRRLEPDVIALQAVRTNPHEYGGKNQADQLVEQLSGYRVVSYVPGTEIGSEHWEGSATIARHEAADVTHRTFKVGGPESPEDTTVRLVIAAAFETAAGRTEVLNAHFSWVKAQNRANIEEALPFLREHARRAMLVGDFNATPDADSLELLREQGFVDAWQLKRPNDPGPTFEADDPKIRIDYAWVTGDLRDSVQAIETFGDERRGERRLSDHLGLVVTLDA